MEVVRHYWKVLRPSIGLTLFVAVSTMLERMAFTSQQVYVPKLMHFYGVPMEETARYTGFLNTITFSLKGVASLFVPFLVGKLGEFNLFVLLNLVFGTFVTLYGFSWNVTSLMLGQILLSISSSNPIVAQCLIFEVCNEENQVLVLLLATKYPLWLGRTLAPWYGGFFALPTIQDTIKIPPKARYFFNKFPVILPNIIIGVLMSANAITAVLLLTNNTEPSKDKEDK